MAKLIEYKELYFAPVTKNNIKEIVELENLIVEQVENKEHFGGLGKQKIEEVLIDRNNLVYGVYNVFTKELMAYAIFTTYNHFPQDYCVLNRLGDANKNQIYYYKIMGVKPEFRGQGIMARTLEFFESYAKKQSGKYIVAFVHPENTYSKNNVDRFGYRLLENTYFENNSPREIIYKKL